MVTTIFGISENIQTKRRGTMNIQITTGIGIPYNLFIERACRLTKAKGVFNSTEENLKDYFSVRDYNGIAVLEVESTRYNTLRDLRDSLMYNKEYHKKTQRNSISRIPALKIINSFMPF